MQLEVAGQAEGRTRRTESTVSAESMSGATSPTTSVLTANRLSSRTELCPESSSGCWDPVPFSLPPLPRPLPRLCWPSRGSFFHPFIAWYSSLWPFSIHSHLIANHKVHSSPSPQRPSEGLHWFPPPHPCPALFPHQLA